MPLTSAPAAAAVALPQLQLLPVLSGPDLRSPQRRAAPPTTATMAAPAITAEIHIIMAGGPPTSAGCASWARAPLSGPPPPPTESPHIPPPHTAPSLSQ